MASVAGIAAIYMTVLFSEPLHVSVYNVTHDKIGNYVIIKGCIREEPYLHEDGHVFFDISETCTEKYSVTVVFFSKEASLNPSIENIIENTNVSVSGRISEYRGELEIIGDKLKII